MAIEIKKANVEFIGKYTVKVTNPYYSRTFDLPKKDHLIIDLIDVKKLNTTYSDATKLNRFVIAFLFNEDEDCHVGVTTYYQANYKSDRVVLVDGYVRYNTDRKQTYEAKLEC